MQRPLVSIVICTYNREKFLPDCLQSVDKLQANPGDYEVIVVDNNSTDTTAELIRDFIESHPHLPVRTVVETQQGLSNARNRGILEAKGHYVAFIDDDAILEPDYVTALKSFAATMPDVMGFGGKIIPTFVEGPEPKWSNPFSRSLFFSQVDYGDQTTELKKTNQYPFGCNMVIKKSYFDEYEPFDSAIGPMSKDGGRCDDKVLFLNMRRRSFPIYYVPGLKVIHQIDTTRLSASYIRKLSEGLGYSLRLLARKEGWLAVLKRGWDVLFKMAAALVLASGYALTGRWAVAVHLIQFRWWVLRGYMQ